MKLRIVDDAEEEQRVVRKQFVNFQEVTDDEVLDDFFDIPDIPDIPEDPEAFEALLSERKQQVTFVEQEPVVEVEAKPEQEKTAADVPAVTVQMMQETSKTEKLLTEFIGNFSYDVILQQIKHAVREELVREMAEAGVTQQASVVVQPTYVEVQPTPVDVPPVSVEVQPVPMEEMEDTTVEQHVSMEEMQEDNIFADLFGEYQTPVSTAVEDEEDDIFAALFGDDSYEAEETTTSEEKDDFNIFEFFEEQDAMEAKISTIEKMEIFGDTVLEITLDDLSLYNKNMLQRG
jgi:hypothetical protein